MPPEAIRLTREELFELVWQKPLTRLATKFGVSDVGLAKICDRLDVPRPAQGHWVKVRHGKGDAQPPLPKTHGPDSVEISRVVAIRRPKKNAIPAVDVPGGSATKHQLVVRLERDLSRAKPDERGLVASPRRGGLVVEVSPANIERALSIMNAFLKALEARSWRVVVGKGPRSAAVLRIDEEGISFSLKERLEKRDHVLTPDEAEREERSGWSWARKFDFAPTGMLRLRLEGLEGLGVQQSWSDGQRLTLEKKLGEAVASVEIAAMALRQQRMEMIERRRRSDEEQRRRAAEARGRDERRLEEERIVLLAERWAASERLLRFAEAVEMAAGYGGENEAVTAWVKRTETLAEQMNPIEIAGVRREFEQPLRCELIDDLFRASSEILRGAWHASSSEIGEIRTSRLRQCHR